MAGNEKVNHIGRKEGALEKIIGPAGPEKNNSSRLFWMERKKRLKNLVTAS